MRLTAETSGWWGELRHGVKARSERYVCVEDRERTSGVEMTTKS